MQSMFWKKERINSIICLTTDVPNFIYSYDIVFSKHEWAELSPDLLLNFFSQFLLWRINIRKFLLNNCLDWRYIWDGILHRWWLMNNRMCIPQTVLLSSIEDPLKKQIKPVSNSFNAWHCIKQMKQLLYLRTTDKLTSLFRIHYHH